MLEKADSMLKRLEKLSSIFNGKAKLTKFILTNYK